METINSIIKSIKPSTIVTICGSAVGIGLTVKALWLNSQEIKWFNKKIYTIDELSTSTQTSTQTVINWVGYTVENINNRDEVLICVRKNDLENMKPEEKAKLFIDLSPGQNKWLERLILEEYITNSTTFYLSCVPVIGENDGVIIKDFGENIECLYERKIRRRNGQITIYALGAFTSFFITALTS